MSAIERTIDGSGDNPIIRASGRNRAIARAVRPERVQHRIADAPASDDACHAACVAAPVIRSIAVIAACSSRRCSRPRRDAHWR